MALSSPTQQLLPRRPSKALETKKTKKTKKTKTMETTKAKETMAVLEETEAQEKNNNKVSDNTRKMQKIMDGAHAKEIHDFYQHTSSEVKKW
jgi:hypothetical protein